MEEETQRKKERKIKCGRRNAKEEREEHEMWKMKTDTKVPRLKYACILSY